MNKLLIEMMNEIFKWRRKHPRLCGSSWRFQMNFVLQYKMFVSFIRNEYSSRKVWIR